jgi:DNA-binding MarR family transcriptional regulator
MLSLVTETLNAYFALQAKGKTLDAVNKWGGGTWGLMSILAQQGSKTVPQIARMRGVTRQRVQKIADELANAGLIVFSDNPDHKRAKLMRLTRPGELQLEKTNTRIRAAASELAKSFSERELKSARSVLARLTARLGAPGAN